MISLTGEYLSQTLSLELGPNAWALLLMTIPYVSINSPLSNAFYQAWIGQQLLLYTSLPSLSSDFK